MRVNFLYLYTSIFILFVCVVYFLYHYKSIFLLFVCVVNSLYHYKSIILFFVRVVYFLYHYKSIFLLFVCVVYFFCFNFLFPATYLYGSPPFLSLNLCFFLFMSGCFRQVSTYIFKELIFEWEIRNTIS